MNKKYIVTLADEYALVHKLTVPVTINGKHTAWIQTDINLTPYTEPDMEQVRKEAYDKGFEDGKEYCPGQLSCMDATYQKGFRDGTKQCANCEDFKESAKAKAYQQGLSDAWEAARKICLGVSEGGMNEKVLCDIFAVEYYRDALRDYSASEAIEKIRQYELKKDRQARIEYNFDEIKDVLNTTMKECNVSLDEIATVLQKMKES